ncbi:MAG TPA: tripartite tricarboxylate transporter TctB family protein, partial [Burkholderiales bacterium]|nr:tripartite tricarboxylate transporter TctB family protein [Burkholderiales bacterium]
MAFHNRDKKDFNAGILYIIMGAFFALWARNYPMGSAVRMGPAYFPTVLGWLLAALGLIIFARSFFEHGGEEPRKTNWRPLTLLLAAVVIFGLLLETGGMVIASFALMYISSLGGHDFKWKEQLVNAVFMTAVNVGLFYYALALPFKLF